MVYMQLYAVGIFRTISVKLNIDFRGPYTVFQLYNEELMDLFDLDNNRVR